MTAYMTAYLKAHKLIADCQFGFLRERSREMALLSVTEPILQGTGKKQLSLLCLFDPSKALDCVPHGHLLARLRSLGVDQPWFNTYLEGGTRAVKVGNTLSDSNSVSCGVLQGSILGPTLFILYTKSIPGIIKNVSSETTVAVDADDTQTVDQFSKSELQGQLGKTGENVFRTGQSYASIGLRLNP